MGKITQEGLILYELIMQENPELHKLIEQQRRKKLNYTKDWKRRHPERVKEQAKNYRRRKGMSIKGLNKKTSFRRLSKLKIKNITPYVNFSIDRKIKELKATGEWEELTREEKRRLIEEKYTKKNRNI